MANNFSNFNQHGMFNYGQRPLNNNQNPIPCRLCNLAFTSIQAFITHTEFHLDQENLSRGRRSFSPNLINPQRQLIPNHSQRNYPRPILMQETRARRANYVVTPEQPRVNPYPYATRVAVSQPIWSCQPPPEPMPSTVSYVAEMTQVSAPPIYQEEMEVSPIGGTKALINQLDKTINDNEFIDMLDMNDDNLELLALNLELRL